MGAKGGHKAFQNRSKIDEKSMQNSMRNSAGFLHGLGSVFGRLWECFWDPGPLILSVSCRRDANLKKFVFFMFGLTFFVILGGFGVVWGVILGAKGRPKWL